MSRKQTLLDEFVQMVDMKESETLIYVLAIHRQALKGIILDKVKGTVLCSQAIAMPQRGGGITNDLIKGSCFWPSYIDDSNAMYMLVPATFFTASAVKNSASYKELQEDDNPVLLKVYGK